LKSRPIMPLLHAHAAGTAWCPAHAAAVGLDDRFLLLAGPGRAGKTTAALACARAGWQYAGDDFVLINPATGRVAPLFASARVRVAGLEAFRSLIETTAIATSNDDDDLRYELRLSRENTSWTMSGGSVVALLLPRRQGATTPIFQKARASEAFAALLPITAAQTPNLLDTLAPKLLRTAKMAPVYTVDTGTSPGAIPGAFGKFLEELS